MPEFPRLTRLPKTNCLICRNTAPLIDGRSLESSLTMGYQERKKIVRICVSLWSLLDLEMWTACWFGGSTDSPEACHIWSKHSISSGSAVLILPRIRNVLTPARPRASSCSGSSRPSPSSSVTLFKKEFSPDWPALAPRDAWAAGGRWINRRSPRSWPYAEKGPFAKSQLELTLVNL